MKKMLLFFCLIALTACSRAQQRGLPIPHYHILKTDSTYTTWNDLKKNRPVMIIYFAPDCPHCQHLMTELKENMEHFKNIQIVMITFTKTEYPYLGLIKNFSRDYDLPKYKNITMGTEYPTYAVQKYYQVTTTPFVAVYNSAGKMVQSFNKPPKISDLVEAVKKV